MAGKLDGRTQQPLATAGRADECGSHIDRRLVDPGDWMGDLTNRSSFWAFESLQKDGSFI